MSVENSVEIHSDDLVFGIVVFQFCRCHPLLELTYHELRSAEVLSTREEVLGELLCQSTASAFVVACRQTENNTQESTLVNA